jgi:hypothetical protein
MKVVFVLGAGFSVEAGAPVQAKLLTEAIRLRQENSSDYDDKRFSIFKSFLTEQLGYAENRLADVELEDIFTPLDRCLAESSQFRGIGLDRIMEVREAVFHVIGRTIRLILDKSLQSKQYINEFADYLTLQSSARVNQAYRNSDPVCAISTNWDILLDNSIHQSIVNNGHNAVVDYCCYISSRDEQDETIKPGLEKLGQGGFNVKLLKLHGSLNWLQCPRCMRLYARFSRKDGVIDYMNRESCRHCDRNFPEERCNHLLASNLIMPTYIKDLSNPQYKVIWQNAGIEIAEASKLVFIGYSLPSADFEMRQLLSRMTRKNATIEVVDHCTEIEKQQPIKNHWRKFFGDREISFHFGGAKAYLDALK